MAAAVCMHSLKKIIPYLFAVAFPVILYSSPATAQLCTGSLGDPVVNIDFGYGGSNTGYVPTNSYAYTSSPCPNDGYYTITNSTANCFGNTWHTVSSDHTGNGAFLLVNASYEPGDFMISKVTNLCPNTTYEFAAWIVNVLSRYGIKPNITFSIETESGTVLQQYNTGDIAETPSAIWRQYGFFFVTPPTNPVIVLRMRNNAPGGIGNDIGLDDITFRPCSATLLTSHINGNTTDTVNVCEGAAGIYNFTGNVSSGSYSLPLYQWQQSTDSGKTWKDISAATTLNYTAKPVTAGAYWYRFTAVETASSSNTGCRIASNYVIVNIHAKPKVFAGGNRVTITGKSIVLNGSVTGDTPLFYWSPLSYLSLANTPTPEALPAADITYTLSATTRYGCSNADTAFIKVIKEIFVPTAFTPNNDNKNDNWDIPFIDPLFGAEVSVFNRFGQRVFYTKSTPVIWNGTFKGIEQPAGTYVYSIHFQNGFPDLKGNIILIR
jgi:gliding motility-associated-like protein